MKIKEIKNIKEHSDNVKNLLLLSDGRFASCSSDKKIKIFNSVSYKCEIRINTDHKNFINYICEFDDGKLASCSLDITIKIWLNKDDNKYECVSTLNQFNDGVNKVINLTSERFASCCNNGQILINKSNYPYDLISILDGYKDKVTSIIQSKEHEYLVSGSYDNSLIFWNLSTFKNEYIVNNVVYKSSNSLIEFINKIIICGLNEVKIIDVKTFKMITVENKDFDSIYSIIPLKNSSHSLILGTQFGMLYQLNIDTSKCKIVKKDGTFGKIFSIIRLRSNCFAICCEDNSIKILK